MKYQNKEGISLNLTQRNNSFTDLVKEVISEAIDILDESGHYDCKEFLKENFDIKDKNE